MKWEMGFIFCGKSGRGRAVRWTVLCTAPIESHIITKK